MSQMLKVKNPYSQESVGEYHFDNLESVKSKFNKVKEAQKIWRKIPLEKRITEVKNALDYFTKNKFK